MSVSELIQTPKHLRRKGQKIKFTISGQVQTAEYGEYSWIWRTPGGSIGISWNYIQDRADENSIQVIN